MSDEFTTTTLDNRNMPAPLDMLGESYMHSGNGHVYTITDVCWIGDIDEWGLIHSRGDGTPTCVRSFTNFAGRRSNGEKRFNLYSAAA